MNKNEYQIKKAVIFAQNLAEILRLIKHLITCSLVGWCTYNLFLFFTACLHSPEPVLNAFATIAEKFELGSTFGFLWGGLATGAWALERMGKKRAIQQKGALQALLEANEPNRTSSGLNHHGETPS